MKRSIEKRPMAGSNCYPGNGMLANTTALAVGNKADVNCNVDTEAPTCATSGSLDGYSSPPSFTFSFGFANALCRKLEQVKLAAAPEKDNHSQQGTADFSWQKRVGLKRSVTAVPLEKAAKRQYFL